MSSYSLPPVLDRDYVLGQRVGGGAHGEVFTARNRYTGVFCACKFVRYLERPACLIPEAAIQMGLDHPNILRMIRYADDSENFRIAMIVELAPEGDLMARLESHHQLGTRYTEPEVWSMFAQIVRGVHYLHVPTAEEAQGGRVPVAHRDLKLTNLLLIGTTIKIADFGISRLLALGDQASTFTGTEPFIAPEVARQGPYGLAADLWAIGVVMFCLVTMSYPFTNEVIRAGFPPSTFRAPIFDPSLNVSITLQRTILGLLRLVPNERLTTDQLLEVRELRMAGEDHDRDVRDIKFAADQKASDKALSREWGLLKRHQAELTKGQAQLARDRKTQEVTQREAREALYATTRNSHNNKRNAPATIDHDDDGPDCKKMKMDEGGVVGIRARGVKGTLRRYLHSAVDRLLPLA